MLPKMKYNAMSIEEDVRQVLISSDLPDALEVDGLVDHLVKRIDVLCTMVGRCDFVAKVDEQVDKTCMISGLDPEGREADMLFTVMFLCSRWKSREKM